MYHNSHTNRPDINDHRSQCERIKIHMDNYWSHLNQYDQEFLLFMLSHIDSDNANHLTQKQWRYLDVIENKFQLIDRLANGTHKNRF